MSLGLLAPRLCQSCTKLDIARQSRCLYKGISAHPFRRSITYTSRRAVSLGTKITPALIEERRKQSLNAKPLPLQKPKQKRKPNSPKSQAAALLDVSIGDQIKSAFLFGESNQASQPVTKKKRATKTQTKTKAAGPKQELSLEEQLKAAFASDSLETSKPAAVKKPKTAKSASTSKLKTKTAAPLKKELSIEEQFKAAFASDTPEEARPTAKKPKKLKVKGLERDTDTGGPIPVSKAVADSLVGVKSPVKNYHPKPTYTEGIGMLNQGIPTTSTRKPPPFKSPTETLPLDNARSEFYLEPSGSFTYDADVMPFGWRNHKDHVYSERKRLPWEPAEDVPPPGVITPQRWPKTQKGWDQLDTPQVHAAEEAYARFNPKQPADSQESHRTKQAAVHATGGHKKDNRQQAELYEMQIKMAEEKRNRASPSQASGGVPNPSHPYLVKTDEPSVRLDTAQPLLIVVDLNGTMLYRPNPKRFPRKFVQRPYSALFLNYCIKTFWVVVWSSARADNVGVMCDTLATPEVMKRDVVAVWARDKFGLSDADYDSRVQCYKRLTKLWDDPKVAQSHPNYANGGRWSQANTVLIDDTPEKARAEPYNAIIVPEFSDDNGKYDGILPAVHDYVNELCFQSNVSNYMRRNPFHACTDYEAVGDSPRSMPLYNAKKAEKERKKGRKDHKYDVSSLNLKNTVAKAK